jgi:hypothetical protein
LTTNLAGKNFLIVRAFVGDSTMISGFFKLSSSLVPSAQSPKKTP